MNEHVSNVTYVCCKCRRSARGRWGERRCPECSQPMVSIGKHWRIPKRMAKREWAVLEEKIVKAQAQVVARREPYEDMSQYDGAVRL